MSGSISIAAPSSTTVPTFFTGIAVSGSFLSAINQMVNNAAAPVMSTAQQVLSQAQATASSDAALLASDTVLSGQAQTSLQAALTAALSQIAASQGTSVQALLANLQTSPTSPTVLQTGQFWNNGGEIAQVQ